MNAPHRPTLSDALAAVRGLEWSGSTWDGLKLSRIVAYALGAGDTVSRRTFEALGPTMMEPGKKRSGSLWLPTRYAEELAGATQALPVSDPGIPTASGWGLMSGTHPDGRFFARAWKGDGKGDNPTFNVTKARSEVLARLDAALQAKIWAEDQRSSASGQKKVAA